MNDSSDRGFLARFGAALLSNGYPIVPIKPGHKAPGPKDWQDIKADQPMLKRWLANGYAHAGVGILTKHHPAVDIDVRDEAAARHMVEWIIDFIDDAPVRIGQAPKALLLFQCDEPFAKMTSNGYRLPGDDFDDAPHRIEILGNGQQFVAYAVHPDTKQPYQWTNDSLNPVDVPSLDLPTLTIDSAKLIISEFERYAEKQAGWKKVSNGSTSQATQSGDIDIWSMAAPPPETEAEIERVKEALEVLKPKLHAGRDYDFWMNTLFALKWTGWKCAEELALEWSESSPFHDGKAFKVKWRAADKRPRANPITLGTLFSAAIGEGWDATRPVDAEQLAQETEEVFNELMAAAAVLTATDRIGLAKLLQKIVQAKLSPTDEEQVLEQVKDKTRLKLPVLRKAMRLYIEQDDNATHAGYAKKFFNKLAEEGEEPVGYGGTIYRYNTTKRIWEGKLPEQYEMAVAKEFDNAENCKRHSDYSAVTKLAYSLAAKGNEEFFEKVPLGLACEGLFYSIASDGSIQKQDLNASHRQRFLSPFKPKVSPTPVFDKYLSETFEGPEKESRIAFLQEVAGAILVGALPAYQKAVLFQGPSRSGKSTFMEILEAMFPHEQRISVNPMKWDEPYFVATMMGARLNTVGELEDDVPVAAAVFKAVTGGDTLTGRHPAGKPFNFKNSAAHVFNSNHFILTKDHSESFYSRWLIVEFPNSRLRWQGEGEPIDRDLLKKMVDPENGEMPGIMAWMLKGLKRLVARGKFEEPPSHHRMMNQWKKVTSSVLEFIADEDECELGDKHRVLRSDFYMAYTTWCRESNRRPLGKIKAFDEVRENGLFAYGIQEGFSKNGTKLFKGISVRRADPSSELTGEVAEPTGEVAEPTGEVAADWDDDSI